jgi:lambda family phage portal protein
VDLNLLERTLAALRPAWGARRLADKLALEQVRVIADGFEARGWDAGRRGRRTNGWLATGGSPNAEMQPSLNLVIRRSRDLVRNNEWARNVARKWVGHAVDTGIVPRPVVDGKKAKQTANDAWASFVDNCDPEGLVDFYAKQALVMREVVTGGACFVRWYLRPPSFGLKVPLQCEVLPHEFLDTRRFQLNGDNLVIHGVEFDPWGRRVAYWLFRQHPGEVLPVARYTLISERVLASEVDHVFFVEEAGQATGMPWLASTALRLRDMGDRDEAALMREKIAACLSVFVRRQGNATRTLAQAADQAKDAKGRDVEKLRPGTIIYGESDGDVTVINPPSSGDIDFTNRNLYGVAAGVGLPHSSVSGNLSNVNFTSLREGKLDFWPALNQVQWFMLAPMLCRPAWKRVMAAAAGRGLQVSTDTGAKWSMPKRPWVNPVDDMKAEAGEMAMALESWADKVAARGHDPEELLAEIQEWRAKLLAAGIDPDMVAGIAGARVQIQDPNADPADTPPPAK